MNPLLKKEIRLLFPAWGLTLLLALAPALYFHQYDDPSNAIANFTPVWLGVLILCASSFGREFSLGTFSSLLVQPFPRRQFWLVKIGVLAAALVSVLLAYSLHTYKSVLAVMGWPVAAWLILLLLTAIAGGLWLALLIRQMMAVIWLVALVPGLLCLPCLFVLGRFNATDKTVGLAIYGLLFIYSVAGIAGSWLIFRRAQDAPWSGGVITLPEWLTAAVMPPSVSTERRQVPWRALVRKEFHFNQVLLLGMGGLFLLHLGLVVVRRSHPDEWGVFGALWLLVPLVIGCSSIAEERKLGTLEGQLCLPVSTRRQFLVKLGFVLLIGGGLSSALLLAAVGLGLEIGDIHGPVDYWVVALIIGVMTAIAFIGFFASSLSRNLLQALPAAIGTLVGIGLVMAVFNVISGFYSMDPVRFVLWNPMLPYLLLPVALITVLPWLAYRNFQRLHEARRVWRRNGLGLGAVVVLTMAASALLYHRAWEKFTVFEPEHEPAYWSLNRRPVALRTDLDNNLVISLPDGRTWFGCLADRQPGWKQAWNWFDYLTMPPAPRLVVRQFVEDADWVSLAVGGVDEWILRGTKRPSFAQYTACRDTVGIRDDGTLWVSEKPGKQIWNTNALVQFGEDSNWREVIGERTLWSVILLKKDGTLWRWGDPFFRPSKAHPAWPGLRAYAPSQIGTNSDWQELVQATGPVAQKSDGSIWDFWLNFKTHTEGMALNTNLNQAGFTHQRLEGSKLAGNGTDLEAGIRQDGTLWIWGHLHWDLEHLNAKNETLQSGRETNWVAVALSTHAMVALKSDGSLWQWGGQHHSSHYAYEYTRPPRRLGTHHDWVALAQTRAGIVSLAADRSLWLWRDDEVWGGQWKLIAPSEKPVALGTILALK